MGVSPLAKEGVVSVSSRQKDAREACAVHISQSRRWISSGMSA